MNTFLEPFARSNKHSMSNDVIAAAKKKPIIEGVIEVTDETF